MGVQLERLFKYFLVDPQRELVEGPQAIIKDGETQISIVMRCGRNPASCPAFNLSEETCQVEAYEPESGDPYPLPKPILCGQTEKGKKITKEIF